MTWFSMLAIYWLFWVISAFVVMPFGLRTYDEDDAEQIPGQVTSAPVNFRPKRILIRTSLLAAVLFGLYYLNYIYGWIPVDSIDLARGGPPGYEDPAYLKD